MGPSARPCCATSSGSGSTITAVGLGLATGVVALLGSPPLVTAGVLVYGLGLVISLIAYTYAIPLTAGLRLGATSGLDFMRQGLLAVATVGLVLAGAGLMPFFVLYPVVAAIVAVATATLVRSQISLRPEFDMRRWRSVVTEAASYSIAAAVGLIYFRVAAILLQYVSTDLQAGSTTPRRSASSRPPRRSPGCSPRRCSRSSPAPRATTATAWATRCSDCWSWA